MAGQKYFSFGLALLAVKRQPIFRLN